jgi:hypothetical protein
MSKHLMPHVEAVLRGETINSQAEEAGCHAEKLRRLVRKHPGYATAKEAGLLHKPGLPGQVPIDRDKVFSNPAVAEVAAGATIADTAVRHGMVYSTLAKMVKMVHPDLDLRKRGPRGLEAAEAAVRSARVALQLAETELQKLRAQE